MTRLGLLLIVLGAWAFCARGFVIAPDEVTSVEWAFEQADAVVRGNVLLDARREFTEFGQRQVVLEVLESLKGDLRGTIVFHAPQEEMPSGEVLVFLTTNRIHRTRYWTVYQRGWIFQSDKAIPHTMRTDMTPVLNFRDLLTAAREAGEFVGRRGSPVLSATLPTGRSFRDPVLRVPADGRLEALGRGWAADADHHVRARAVSALRPFMGGESMRLIERLAHDPYFEVNDTGGWVPDIETRARKFYPVRSAVRNVTSGLGLKIEVEPPYLRYRAVNAWKSLALLGCVAIFVALWPRRGRGLGLGGWASAAAIAAIVAIAVMAWRGLTVADTFSYAADGANWEATFAGGRVIVMRVQDTTRPHPVMVRRYPAGEYASGLWYEGWSEQPASLVSWRGFRSAEGVMPKEGYAYRQLIVPYWMLAAVLAIWPVWWGVQHLGRATRRRAWARANRCTRCGYDLRGLGGVCPECGAGVRVIPRWRRRVEAAA